MANSSFCAEAIVAPDSAETDLDLMSRQPCRLVFKKVAQRASIFLEFPIPTHGSDEHAITLAYDANMLSSGEQSLERPRDTIHLRPEEHAAITRNKSSGMIKHLTLMIKEKCCRILMPRSIENTERELGFIALYDQVVTLAKATRIHVLFDYNYVHKKDRSKFMQFILHPEKLSGYLVDVSPEGKLMEVDPFGPYRDTVHDVQPLCVDTVYPPTEATTEAAIPNTPPPYTNAPHYSPTEKATTVATPGTPPPYTKASNRQSEHTHGLQVSPTEKATTEATSSTQSPCINASKTHAWQVAQTPVSACPRSQPLFGADMNTLNSPVPSYSPDTHAPILQDIVRNAIESRLIEFEEIVKNEVESRLAEVVRDVLPSILQHAFEVKSPQNLSPGRLDFAIKASLRAILSEEAAAQLEDKVDDITQNLESYAEDLSAALENEWRDQVEDVISSLQEESVSEIHEVTAERIRKIKDTGKRIREDAADEFAEFNATLKHIEAVARVRSNDLCNTCHITPRKRAGGELASGSSKRPASIDHLRGEVSRVAHALEGMNAVQRVNHKPDAITSFIKHFAALDEQLQLTVIEAFEVDSLADTYVLLTPKLKKLWVQRQLERRRDALYSTGVDFGKLMAEIDWNKEGDVTRKLL